MKYKGILFIVFVLLICSCSDHDKQIKKPNILLIYLDDMGYGDAQCYNPESKIHTPNIDRLATEGIRFTNAYTPAPICGPSRYGLLTGRYPWRRGVGGTGNGEKFRDTFIEKDRLTLASLLKSRGYNTAQIGKWGLRHKYSDAVKAGKEPGYPDSYDFPNKRLLGSQLFGFDYSWCMTHLFPAPGTKQIGHSKHQFENGLPISPGLEISDPYEWLPGSAQKVLEYLEAYAGTKQNSKFKIKNDQPFFIYWDPPSPHLPLVPNDAFVGKSKAGPYGDFMIEIDHYLGQILNSLDQLNLTENTIVIFSSDNGPENIAYKIVQDYQHYSMGELRGVKRDIYEGGTKVPFIVRWPNKISEGEVANDPICLTDLMASVADLLNYELPANAGEDSYSLLPVLLDKPYEKPLRGPIIFHTPNGRFGVRSNDMLFIDAASGAQSAEPAWFREERKVVPHQEKTELFDLSRDPQLLKNIADTNPETVGSMRALLHEKLKKSR